MNSAPFAVLLNPNAKRVSRNVRDRIADIVHPDHVYVSQSESEAPRVVEAILERGYDTVFAGGGDGTVTQFINMLPEGESPRLGILRLGTGNAMAGIVSSGDPLVDLRTFASNPSADAYNLSLCESEGVRFAFAGLGLDAHILNDYRMMKSRLKSPLFQRALHNVAGYWVSCLGVTVPRMLSRWIRRQQTQVTIRNVGDDSYGIDRTKFGGKVGRSFKYGEILYQGPANAVMFGTCPYYGYNIKMLPFAGLETNRFHLRVSNIPSGRVLVNSHKMWKGTLEHSQLWDFHADRVHMSFSEPMPYQLAGEAMGYRDELTVGLSGSSVDLVRFI